MLLLEYIALYLSLQVVSCSRVVRTREDQYVSLQHQHRLKNERSILVSPLFAFLV